jgi:hypothetical protein
MLVKDTAASAAVARMIVRMELSSAGERNLWADRIGTALAAM